MAARIDPTLLTEYEDPASHCRLRAKCLARACPTITYGVRRVQITITPQVALRMLYRDGVVAGLE